jgi:uncharacterized membrane protein YccF (DUF307 family)
MNSRLRARLGASLFRRGHFIDLLPVLLPALLIVDIGLYAPRFIARPPDAASADRIIWAAFSMSFTFLLVMAGGLSMAVLLRAIPTFSTCWRIIKAYALIGLTLALIEPSLVRHNLAVGPVGELILTGAKDAANFQRWPNVLAKCSILAAIGAAIALGWQASSVDERELAWRLESLRLLLTVWTLTLASGVLEVTALFRYGASASVDSQSLEGQADAIAIGAGLIFSILLLIILGPAVVRLERRFKALAVEAAATELRAGRMFSLEQWSISRGLVGRPLENSQSALKFILPLATGLAADLLRRYFGRS